MRIRTESGIGHTAVNLAGRFDAHETAAFRGVVDALLGPDRATVRLDLSNVVFVDSSALAELLRVQKAARAAGGEVVLVNVSDPVRIILELTELKQVFTLETTAQTASTPS
ncbi:MAG TPA: STAS domain-containing protein [Cryobacterium sp.]|nr:STAS domain-containing protein [Cryobacterium sp.]